MLKAKRIVSIILSLLITVSLFSTVPVTANAELSSNFNYDVLEDGTAEITYYYGTASSLTIPSELYGYKVTSIGDSSFRHNSNLTDVTIPDSVTKIADYAFYSVKYLTNVIIPNNVKSIGSYAFCNCNNLKDINIPKSVTKIGLCAFDDCSQLQSIYVDENNNNYSSINGNLYNKDNTELIQYAIGKTDTVFPIPDSVTHIGKYAFRYCDNLTDLAFPESVTTFDEEAFANCKNLSNIKLPKNATEINDYCFRNCSNLISITIPKSLKTIKTGAFAYCSNLKTVYYSGSESDWKSITIIYTENSYLLDADIHYNVQEPAEPVTESGENSDSGSYNVTLQSLIDTDDSGYWYAYSWYNDKSDGEWFVGDDSYDDFVHFNKLHKNVFFVRSTYYPGYSNSFPGKTEDLEISDNTVYVVKGNYEYYDSEYGYIDRYTGFWSDSTVTMPSTQTTEPIETHLEATTASTEPANNETQAAEKNTSPSETTSSPINIDVSSIKIELPEGKSTATDGDVLYFSLKVTDKSSSISNVQVVYKNTESNRTKYSVLSYDEEKDLRYIRLYINEKWESGDWKIYSIFVSDNDNNYLYLYNAELNPKSKTKANLSAGDFTVTGTNADVTPPEIDASSLKIELPSGKSSVITGDKIKLSLKVTDNESPISRVSVDYENIATGEIRGLYPFSYNSKTDLYEAEILLNDSWESGDWTIHYIHATGNSDNYIFLYNSEYTHSSLFDTADLSAGDFKLTATAATKPTDAPEETTSPAETKPLPTEPAITPSSPVLTPTETPTVAPTVEPTIAPTVVPSEAPSTAPSVSKVKKAQSITAKSYTKTFGSKDFWLNAYSSGNGKLTFKSNKKSVASVSLNGKVTIKACGKTTITITAASTSTYKSATKKITVTIKPAKVKIKKVTAKNNKIVLNINKQKGLSKYEVEVAADSSFETKLSRALKGSKTKVEIAGVSSGKTYYIRIRAFAKIDGKKVYSKWTTKKIKVK